MTHINGQIPPDIETIEKYNTPEPRYTSYPTTLEFHEGIGERDYKIAAEEGNGALLPRDLSLYFYLPFCRHLCLYCDRNKIVTGNEQKSDKYLKYLFQEIQMHGDCTDWDRKVRQLHLGGGTPTYYTTDQIEQLMHQVHRYFSLVSEQDRDYSIEIDPRTVGYQYLLSLLRLGFNRISLSVQDFNPQVQKAVHRLQPEALTRNLILQARSIGFHSINVDLICGLPLQTQHSFGTTLERVLDCAPDRISVYNYAHLPDIFPSQKRIDEKDLPVIQEKVALIQMTSEKLLEAGYLHIGMDQYVKPGDSLIIAQSKHGLYRNIQGYTTYRDCDQLGIGIGAIGSFEEFNYQNARDLDNYYRLIDKKQLPVNRGLHLSLDDSIRKDIIMQIMCENKIDKNRTHQYFGIIFDDYFDRELGALEEFVDDSLIELESRQISITPTGRFFLHNIARIFNAYSKSRHGMPRLSNVI